MWRVGRVGIEEEGGGERVKVRGRREGEGRRSVGRREGEGGGEWVKGKGKVVGEESIVLGGEEYEGKERCKGRLPNLQFYCLPLQLNHLHFKINPCEFKTSCIATPLTAPPNAPMVERKDVWNRSSV